MIQTAPAIASTNAELLTRLAEGANPGEGDWLVANRQSAGRGRAGRPWRDGAGNFMGSTIALLRGTDPPAPTLALVAGLAVHGAVAAARDEFASSHDPSQALVLKWPNDLLLDGAKLAGVLLERQGEAVVVGIGVNLASAPALPERRTTCLAAHGCRIERDDFAGRLAGLWAKLLQRWHDGEWPGLRAEWLARAHPCGTPLTVAGIGSGRFAGIAEDGAAHLRLADGSMRVIHAGEVEMVGSDAAGG